MRPVCELVVRAGVCLWAVRAERIIGASCNKGGPSWVSGTTDRDKLSITDMALQGKSGEAGRPSGPSQRRLVERGMSQGSGWAGSSAGGGLRFLLRVK